MKIHDNHMYHGAALIQVAEDKNFTAINLLKVGSNVFSNAYKINSEISLYLKYASKKNKSHEENIFTFNKQHLKDLEKIYKAFPQTFIALVCVEDREICCLSYEELNNLIELRKKEKGSTENQYTILVKIPRRSFMRVYVNAPGVKNRILGKELKMKRKDYPSRIFDK
jgi:hypothetical protein